jgi:Leucine-rich repeat (LRR) protein
MRNSFLLIFILIFINSAFSQVITKELFTSQEEKIVSISNEEMQVGLKKSVERSRFSRRFEIEFRKKGYFPKPINERIGLDFRVIVNENQKVDSVYYLFSILKIDTISNNLKMEVLKDFDIDNERFVIEVLRNVLQKTTIKLNLGKAYSFRFGYNVRIANRDFSRNFKTVVEYLNSVPKDTTGLDLSRFKLSKVPKKIRGFDHLENLNLSNNNFSKIRFNPRKYPKLNTLSISINAINEKSIRIRKNKNLKIINLSFNDILKVPSRLFQSQNLEDLILSNNFIFTIDDMKFNKFKNLKMLNLYQNELETISANIKLLPKIEILDFYHNCLMFLPNEISELKTLKSLAVSNNQLWKLPDTINQLTNLNELYLHHNKLDSLPALPAGLIKLDVGYNLFKTIPKCIKDLPKMTELDVSNNRLTDGHKEFSFMNSLKTLYIINNDFKSIDKNYTELQQIIVDLEKKSIIVR